MRPMIDGSSICENERKDTKPKLKLIFFFLECIAALGVKDVDMYLLTGAHICEHAQKKSFGHVIVDATAHCNMLQHPTRHCNSLQHSVLCSHEKTIYKIVGSRTCENDNTLQHMTTHCNTWQHTGTQCIVFTQENELKIVVSRILENDYRLQHTKTHCSAWHRTATQCVFCSRKKMINFFLGSHICENDNTLQHTTTNCNTWQHTASQCVVFTQENDSKDRWVTYMWKRPHTATHCNTTTHCSILQHNEAQNIYAKWL